MQGVGVPDEDLTEDRGIHGKRDPMPGGAGCEEGEDVRRPGRWGKYDVGGERPRERGRGEGEYRRPVHGEAPGGAVLEEPNQGDAEP